MRIDAHLHLWRRARGDYGWLTPDHGALWRDFEPRDAEQELRANAIDRAILVQAAPTVAETAFLLEIAAAAPWVAGVVGWVDLETPDCAEALAMLTARQPLLRGVRPMVQDHPDSEWLTRPAVHRGLAAVAAARLTFDALVKPRHLPCLLRALDAAPDLTVVLDHGGKPALAGGDHAAWARDVRAIAQAPNTACKLSGLVTEVGPGWTLDDLKRPYHTLLDAFGPERMIWGSDWPVCTLASGYGAWLSAAEALTADLGPEARDAIFGGTAIRAYRLPLGRP